MPLYVNDPVAARRRVRLQLTLDSDGKSPATGESGGQPSISVNGGAPTTTNVGTLVAIDASRGLYYTELAQAALAGLSPLDLVTVIYDSAATVPEARDTVVEVLPYADMGTLQAGATGSATLAATASATNDAYRDMVFRAYAGTGAGQLAEIAAYNGATKVAAFRVAVGTAFDPTTRYVIEPAPLLVPSDQVTIGTVNALAPAERTAIGTAVWASATRTLTSFGTLIADIWASAVRTLSGFGTLASDTAAAVAIHPTIADIQTKATTAATAADAAATDAAAAVAALAAGVALTAANRDTLLDELQARLAADDVFAETPPAGATVVNRTLACTLNGVAGTRTVTYITEAGKTRVGGVGAFVAS